MKDHSLKFYLLLSSVMGHLILFLFIGFFLDFSQKHDFGNRHSLVISSYLSRSYFAQFMTARIREYPDTLAMSDLLPKPAYPPYSRVRAKGFSVKESKVNGSKLHLSRSKGIKSQPQNNNAEGKGESLPVLLALLHHAIQKQQHYPLSAREMEREGRVILKFILYTNGTISDLKVIKSSGTTSLDDAALAAVQNAAPFEHVQEYLTSPQEYNLQVVFKLT